jgi:hypothetical protein
VARKSLTGDIDLVTCPPCKQSVREASPVAAAPAVPPPAQKAPGITESVVAEPSASSASSDESDESEQQALDLVEGLDVDAIEASASAEETSVSLSDEEPLKKEESNGKSNDGGVLSMVTMALEQIVPKSFSADPSWPSKVEASSLSDEDKKVFHDMIELCGLARMFKMESLGDTLLSITAKFADMAIGRETQVPALVVTEEVPTATETAKVEVYIGLEEVAAEATEVTSVSPPEETPAEPSEGSDKSN